MSQPARGISVDEKHWPLIVKRSGLVLQVEDMREYLRKMDALLAKKQPFVVVVIANKGQMDRKIIGEYGDWVKKNKELMGRYYLGCAFVFPGDVFRFILSAILLAAPAPVPHDVFGDVDKAIAWCNRKLLEAGLRTQSVTAKDLQ